MGDQINAIEILHSFAIYIQNMKLARSLSKKLLVIESVKKITPIYSGKNK